MTMNNDTKPNISQWDFIGVNVLDLRENPFPDYDAHFNKTKIITDSLVVKSTLRQLKTRTQERLSAIIKEDGPVDLGNPLLILVNEPTSFYSSLSEESFKNIIDYIKNNGDAVNIFYRESYSLIPPTKLKLPELGVKNRVAYKN